MANEEEVIITNDEKAEEVIEAPEEKADEQEHEESANEQRESPEAKLARLKRQAERLEKKLGLTPEVKPTSKKSNDLDYGEKAYLVSNGIKGADEMGLVKEFIKNTGKSIDDIIESKFFKAELADLRELRNTANATPTGSKRANQSAQDSVEYWIAKGELPKDVELRRKVVNARIKQDSTKGVFYNS